MTHFTPLVYVEHRKIRMDFKAVKTSLESSEINRVDCVVGSQQLFEYLIKKGVSQSILRAAIGKL